MSMRGTKARRYTMKRKSLPPHWYKHYISECPVCGRGEDRRERQFTPAPPPHAPERWEYDVAYDWCDAL